MKQLLLTIKAQIHADAQVQAVLRDAMRSATKVYNGLLWHLRQEQAEKGKVDLSLKNLNFLMKFLPRAKEYYSMSTQMTRNEVRQAYLSFFALRRQGHTKHQAPGFRYKNYLSPLKYVQSGFEIKGDRVELSLGLHRADGVRHVSFRISHRPDLEYKRVREISIIYDLSVGRLEARLVVEIEPLPNFGTGKVAIDLGETLLMACAFSDGTVSLYSGRAIKALRRYWQKVRAKLKRKSRRWWQVAHRERRQVEHLLHIATSHFLAECLKHGVGEMAIGDIHGIREGIDYGKKLNQRLHAWPFAKIMGMLKYKGAKVGIKVHENISERNTSKTCHACGTNKKAQRVKRGLYRCLCGWTAQADVNASLNIFERAHNVSPVKRGSGRVARPMVVSYTVGWHGVIEPKRKGSLLRASA